ncbi:MULTISPECIES: hypothetical protein [unclassified Novosphingobium]|uniref:hypothetical protein n=1 Tax=unclassified Novosphingobium TaxID=2644732 RepID=UPI00135B6871|nr:MULTISPECIES: hypothetical protein [unclassified Novosphingobium]
MRMPQKKYLLGAAALALLGAGVAEAATARLHTMNVEAPDGSVVHVQYTGEVAPRVRVVPADAVTPADMPMMGDPFAHMDQISAMMDAQVNAMMQRAALMQQQAAANGNAAGAPGFTAASDTPQGMQMTYYSTSTDANGCTRSVSYNSDGSGEAPKMTQAASDGCDAARPGSQAIPAKAEVPVGQQAPKEALGPKV